MSCLNSLMSKLSCGQGGGGGHHSPSKGSADNVQVENFLCVGKGQDTSDNVRPYCIRTTIQGQTNTSAAGNQVCSTETHTREAVLEATAVRSPSNAYSFNQISKLHLYFNLRFSHLHLVARVVAMVPNVAF